MTRSALPRRSLRHDHASHAKIDRGGADRLISVLALRPSPFTPNYSLEHPPLPPTGWETGNIRTHKHTNTCMHAIPAVRQPRLLPTTWSQEASVRRLLSIYPALTTNGEMDATPSSHAHPLPPGKQGGQHATQRPFQSSQNRSQPPLTTSPRDSPPRPETRSMKTAPLGDNHHVSKSPRLTSQDIPQLPPYAALSMHSLPLS